MANADVVSEALKSFEGEVEAGVFVLKPAGWWIWRRERFPDANLASAWAQTQIQIIASQKRFTRFRMSIVSEPETLDQVRAEYEELRLAAHPDFIELDEQ